MTTMIDRGLVDAKLRSRVQTPWGLSDDAGKTIAHGIRRFSTPSHGGYYLSEERTREFERTFPGVVPFAGRGWFEEDCDWSLVVMCWSEHFSRAELAMALRVVQNFGARKWASVAKWLESDSGQAVKATADAYLARHADHWSVTSASTRGRGWCAGMTHETRDVTVFVEMTEYPDQEWYARMADGSFVPVAE